ncbi:MAG: DUF1559 domain-containing protein [Lacipirellulaceae bacterium]
MFVVSQKIKSPHRRKAFTLVELLVVFAIIGVLVGLLLSAVQAARESARRMNCQSNLKNVSLACLSYESSQGRLPPGSAINRVRTRNGLSLHVELLSYVEQNALEESIKRQVETFRKNDPARQPPNIYDLEQVNEIEVEIYRCPSDSEVIDNRNGEDLSASSYAGVTGSAASRGDAEHFVGEDDNLCGVVNFDGVFFPGSRVKLRQIQDGTTNTLLFGERWYQLRAWTAGAFWRPEATGSLATMPVPDSCLSALKNVDMKAPLNASLPTDGYYRGHEDDDRPGPAPPELKITGYNNLPFGSFHPGGANFSTVDGSVHFVNNDIAGEILLALASRDGAELTPEPWN